MAMPPDLFLDSAHTDSGRRTLSPEEVDKLPYIHRLLLGYYGEPKAREPWDPLTQFIYSYSALAPRRLRRNR